MATPYHVKLDVFEGPFDLLYHLVQQEEIDIWDIPIARITDQYLAYLDALRELNIEVAAEFLVMAARLIRIKARMLLPDERTTDEDDDEEDPRLDLAAALAEYAMFKEAAGHLEKIGEGRWAYLGRPEVYAPTKSAPMYDDPAGGVTATDLARAFLRVLSAVPKQRPLPIPHSKVNVADRVSALRQMFEKRTSMAFDELFTSRSSRPEIVATFLALLELVRRGYLYAEQDAVFGPIVIRRRPKDQEAKVNPEAEEV